MMKKPKEQSYNLQNSVNLYSFYARKKRRETETIIKENKKATITTRVVNFFWWELSI